jgi:hypothetical protein
MSAILRWQIVGSVAIMIGAALVFTASTVSAQQATPGASPVAMPFGHPAHIHSGTCNTLGDVVYPLNPVAGSPDASTGAIPVELSVTRVEASLQDILASPHAINVHESAENIGHYIACGNVAGTVSGQDLFVGLAVLNDSGESGIAWLHDNGDGSTTVSVFLAKGLSGGASPVPSGTPTAVASPTA